MSCRNRIHPGLGAALFVTASFASLVSSGCDVTDESLLDRLTEGVCQGDELLADDGTGMVISTTCPNGCGTDPVPHCLEIDFSLPRAELAEACSLSTPFETTEAMIVNTETGEIRTVASGTLIRAGERGVDASTDVAFDDISQDTSTFPDARRVGLFLAQSWTIAHDLQVEGENALALVACDAIELSAMIDASATRHNARAGGYAGDNGVGPGGAGAPENRNSDWFAASGGGGGYGGDGGDGNDGEVDSMVILGGVGGLGYEALNGIPLLGGSSGSVWSLGGNTDSGAGGGAIYLAAGRIVHLDSAGVVHVGGGGGDTAYMTNGPGGGGSGGSIFIEAPEVDLEGGATLAANGGGGGAHYQGGCLMMPCTNTQGQNGSPDATPAAGGVADSNYQGHADGGQGGAAGSPHGVTPAPVGNTAPAGGGGAGRLRIHSRTGQATALGAVLSPAASDLDSMDRPLVVEDACRFE